MNVNRRPAEFIVGLRYDDLATSTRVWVRTALMDMLGTCLAGTTTPAAGIARRFAELTGAAGPAHVLGTETTLAEPAAAFANAVAASALDYDDGHYNGGAGHPGSPIVPAALAVAERAGASGRQLATAIVAGYEVGVRAGNILFPRRPDDVYHMTGTMGTIGAAAAAASVLGLDAERAHNALALAWAHAPMASVPGKVSMIAQFGPMVKESIGWASLTGVAAAQLAADGFTAAVTPFDLEGADSDFVRSLGSTFVCEESYFKPYAACRYTHAALDAVREIVAREGLTPDGIKRVRVGAVQRAVTLASTHPVSLEQAQYSFPFTIACLLLEGDAGPAQIAAPRLSDERLLELATRVEVYEHPRAHAEYPAHYSAVGEILTTDGRRFEQFQREARGDRERPMSEHDLQAKFRKNLEFVGGDADNLLQAIEHLMDGPVADLVAATPLTSRVGAR